MCFEEALVVTLQRLAIQKLDLFPLLSYHSMHELVGVCLWGRQQVDRVEEGDLQQKRAIAQQEKLWTFQLLTGVFLERPEIFLRSPGVKQKVMLIKGSRKTSRQPLGLSLQQESCSCNGDKMISRPVLPDFCGRQGCLDPATLTVLQPASGNPGRAQ